MTTNVIPLNGCASTPLLAYLKALGVFRLIASPLNHARETAADPEVRGWWTNGRFHLRSKLNYKTILQFFLEDYAPSAIIAPWNSNSGFYPDDNKIGFDPLTQTNIAKRFLPIHEAIQIAIEEIDKQKFFPQLNLIIGKKAKTARYKGIKDKSDHKTLLFTYQVTEDDFDMREISIDVDALKSNNSTIIAKRRTNQLANLSLGVHSVTISTHNKTHVYVSDIKSVDNSPVVTDLLISSSPANGDAYTVGEEIHIEISFSESIKVTCRPVDKDKTKFISALRSLYSAPALNWLDTVATFSGDRLDFPPLLGTGGNDGRLDFTNNFMQHLVRLFDITTGKPLHNALTPLKTSLFGNTSPSMRRGSSAGQFYPISAKAPNGTSMDYESDRHVNPWDFIFMLEGTIMFAGAATRRHQGSHRSSASFPFMVRTVVGAGYKGASDTDEKKGRAEFWAPVWNQSASYEELAALLKEGRAVLNGKTVNDGLGFARAVASLGISRGVEHFERYGFVMRSGKAYLAVPLGTQQVSQKITDGAKLINDLDAGGWLEGIRQFGRKKENSSSHGRELLKRFEDALFEMTQADASPPSVQRTLIALGDFVSWLAKNGTAFDEKPSPPPLLSSDWIRKANDGSFEFRIASALASLGWQSSQKPGKKPYIEETSLVPDEENGHDSRSPDQTATENGTKSRSTGEFDIEIAMAAHFAPVNPGSIRKKRRRWDQEQIYKALTVWGGGNLTSNLIAVLERRLIEQSSRGLKDKPLSAATHVRLADISAFLEPGFDHLRCTKLLSGLIWARPAGYLEYDEQSADRLAPPFPYAALKPIFTANETLKKLKLLSPDPNSRIPIPPGLVAQLRNGKVDGALRTAIGRMRASKIDSPFDLGQISRGAGRFGFSVDGKLLAASLLIPLYERDLEHVMKQAYNIDEQ